MHLLNKSLGSLHFEAIPPHDDILGDRKLCHVGKAKFNRCFSFQNYNSFRILGVHSRPIEGSRPVRHPPKSWSMSSRTSKSYDQPGGSKKKAGWCLGFNSFIMSHLSLGAAVFARKKKYKKHNSIPACLHSSPSYLGYSQC